MGLRNFSISNSDEIDEAVPVSKCANPTKKVKRLGLQWRLAEDYFVMPLAPNEADLAKRSLYLSQLRRPPLRPARLVGADCGPDETTPSGPLAERQGLGHYGGQRRG